MSNKINLKKAKEAKRASKVRPRKLAKFQKKHPKLYKFLVIGGYIILFIVCAYGGFKLASMIF